MARSTSPGGVWPEPAGGGGVVFTSRSPAGERAVSLMVNSVRAGRAVKEVSYGPPPGQHGHPAAARRSPSRLAAQLLDRAGLGMPTRRGSASAAFSPDGARVATARAGELAR